METSSNCTCWWGSYIRHGGGTDWDIVTYDPKCPEHFPKDEEVLQTIARGNPDLARDMERGK